MIINYTNRKISALLFCTIVAVNTPMFCVDEQDNEEVELVELCAGENNDNSVESSAGESRESLLPKPPQSTCSGFMSSVRKYKKNIIGTCIALLCAGGAATGIWWLVHTDTALNLTQPPCELTIELNPHQLPDCFGADKSQEMNKREFLKRYAQQSLLVTAAACKAKKTDDCADICSTHDREFGWFWGLDFDFMLAEDEETYKLVDSACPTWYQEIPKESNFALCPVKPEDIPDIEECRKPVTRDATPLENLEQHTNITDISGCASRSTPPGLARNNIAVIYPEVLPGNKELPHHRHGKLSKSDIEECSAFTREIQRAKKLTGCSVVIK